MQGARPPCQLKVRCGNALGPPRASCSPPSRRRRMVWRSCLDGARDGASMAPAPSCRRAGPQLVHSRECWRARLEAASRRPSSAGDASGASRCGAARGPGGDAEVALRTCGGGVAGAHLECRPRVGTSGSSIAAARTRPRRKQPPAPPPGLALAVDRPIRERQTWPPLLRTIVDAVVAGLASISHAQDRRGWPVCGTEDARASSTAHSRRRRRPAAAARAPLLLVTPAGALARRGAPSRRWRAGPRLALRLAPSRSPTEPPPSPPAAAAGGASPPPLRVNGAPPAPLGCRAAGAGGREEDAARASAIAERPARGARSRAARQLPHAQYQWRQEEVLGKRTIGVGQLGAEEPRKAALAQHRDALHRLLPARHRRPIAARPAGAPARSAPRTATAALAPRRRPPRRVCKAALAAGALVRARRPLPARADSAAAAARPVTRTRATPPECSGGALATRPKAVCDNRGSRPRTTRCPQGNTAHAA